MNWLAERLLACVLAVVLGGLAGYVFGRTVGTPVMGELLGAAIAVALLGTMETLRGYRLIQWLRGPQDAPAPHSGGFWGEIADRVERSIRQRDQRIAQEELRLSQFLSAIEASPNGVLMLDAGDQIEWCNSVAADHFGLDPQRDRRQRVTNLVRTPAFVTYLQAEKFDEPVDVPNPRGKGTLSVLIQVYGEGLKLVLSQDVTERERAEGMRRDFVANVSHEIRTPLTVLSGFIETMSNLPLTEVERRRVLELMSQQTTRMQTLVGDLLILAQLEGSPRPASDRWVPVQRVLAQVQADAEALSAKRHALSFNGTQALQIAGAEAELLSAATNLVNNAIRYTPAGGSVEVSWVLGADNMAELEVRDSGIGIAREHLPRLTERFYRVDGSRSRDTGGTGLGLSIVKHVAQRHGADLDIRSELGKGSSFKLAFPAARVRCVEAAAESRRGAARNDRVDAA